MLVLCRKKNEALKIDGDITITILEIRGASVKLGIEAPRETNVYRPESKHANKEKP